ncbi:IS30 family transposase [Listeria monocytogenes]|nr:IS30 family transposase [Listeria monocytogenes]
MNYKQFNIDERACIASFLREGKNYSVMAELLGRSVSSVSREIKRNANEQGVYNPSLAQIKADTRKTQKKNRSKYSLTLKQKIEADLLKGWSPEQIVGTYRTAEDSFVCHKTIYRWLRKGDLVNGNVIVLRRKGEKYKRRTDVNRMRGGKNIRDRPKEARDRKRIGDFELDTVVGCKGTKSCLLTIVDRKSRFLFASLIPDRTAARVSNEISRILSDEVVHTLTADNGKEFSNFSEIEQNLQTEVYFADPYASWQRGTNENTNGLLREYVPKGVDIGTYTQEQIQEYVYMLNTRPRKVLNYQTPEQVYYSDA